MAAGARPARARLAPGQTYGPPDSHRTKRIEPTFKSHVLFIARCWVNTVFAPRFVRGGIHLSLDHFKTKFRAVREARNDVYHHKSVARMTDVVFHAEDLLDYLDFSLDFVCNKITDVPPTKLRFAVLVEARHRTW